MRRRDGYSGEVAPAPPTGAGAPVSTTLAIARGASSNPKGCNPCSKRPNRRDCERSAARGRREPRSVAWLRASRWCRTPRGWHPRRSVARPSAARVAEPTGSEPDGRRGHRGVRRRARRARHALDHAGGGVATSPWGCAVAERGRPRARRRGAPSIPASKFFLRPEPPGAVLGRRSQTAVRFTNIWRHS